MSGRPRRVGYANLGSAGRFANQLWQVASTVGMARAAGVDPVFPEAWDYRPYLSMPDHWFDDRALRRSTPAASLSGLPAAQRPYLQQWAYVAPVLDEVRRAFAPSPLAAEWLHLHLTQTDQLDVSFDRAVALHVRRGDNTDPETHPVGSWPLVATDYYRKALDRIGPGGVLVFSDDYDWCVANLPEIMGGHHDTRKRRVIVPGPSRAPDYFPDLYAADAPMDWIDLQLMARCRSHIIANSTYSLWGAVLADGDPVCYPNNWVGWRNRASLPEESTLVPPDWVMVDNPVDPEHLTPKG